jgi:hypothetical protein
MFAMPAVVAVGSLMLIRGVLLRDPAAELDAWRDLAEGLRREFGEFNKALVEGLHREFGDLAWRMLGNVPRVRLIQEARAWVVPIIQSSTSMPALGLLIMTRCSPMGSGAIIPLRGSLRRPPT